MMEAHDQLAEQVAALRARFAALAPELAGAAGALEEPGAPPPAALLDSLAAAAREFDDVRAAVLDAASALDAAPAEEPVDLAELARILEEVVAAEARRRALAAAREAAVAVLDRVLATAHRDDPGFRALVECQARGRELRGLLDGPPAADDDPEVIAAQVRPFAELLTLLEGRDDLDDDRWAELDESVSKTFGRPLAIALARGKLMIVAGGAPGGPPRRTRAPVAPPAPAAVILSEDDAPPRAPVVQARPLMLDTITPDAEASPEPESPPLVAESAEPVEPVAAEPAMPDQTAQWFVSAWARWSGWKGSVPFGDAVREELGKYPYLLSVPVQQSVDYEGGLLAYGYSLLLHHLEQRVPGVVTSALNSLNAGGGDGGQSVGERLYEYLVTEGRLPTIYPDFVREVLAHAVPDPGPWTQARVLESNAETRVFTRPGRRIGEADQSAQRLINDRQRFASHRFAVPLGPLTVRFFSVVADVRETRALEVQLTLGGRPSDHAWLLTAPAPGRSDQKVEVRRLAEEGTTLGGLGRDFASVWVAVFNPDPADERRYDLVLGLKRDIRGGPARAGRG